MDLLKYELNKNKQLFMEKLLEMELYPTITRPTRITKSSATLIDNIIISKTLYSKQNSCIIINDTSDHLPCLSVLRDISVGKEEKVMITKRNMKGRNINAYKNSLAEIDWTEVLLSNDVNI